MQQRFQISITILMVVMLLSVIRTALGRDPLYELAEPVITQLDTLTNHLLGPDIRDTVAPNEIAQSQIAALEQENEELRTQLALESQSDQQVTAEIIRQDVFGFKKTVWINKGESHGLRAGSPVLVEDFLFGVLTEVYDNSSLITLLVDPEFTATVATPDNKHALLKVAHGSVLVDLLPAVGRSGELVSTDGLDGLIRPSLQVGILGDQLTPDDTPFAQYQLRIPYNPVDVRFVQVETGAL